MEYRDGNFTRSAIWFVGAVIVATCGRDDAHRFALGGFMVLASMLYLVMAATAHRWEGKG